MNIHGFTNETPLMTSNSPNSASSRALVAFPFTESHSPLRTRSSRSSLLSSQDTLEEEQEQWQPILHASNQVVLYNPRSHALSIAAASTSNGVGPGVVVARRQRRESAGTATGVIGDTCPYCKQSLPVGVGVGRGVDEEAVEVEGRWEDSVDSSDEFEGEIEEFSTDPAYHSRASDYFRLLAIANETFSAASGSRRPSLSPGGYLVGEGDDTGSRRRSRSRSRRRSRDRPRTPDPARENRSTRGAFPAEKMAEGYFKAFFQEEYKLGMGANGSVFLCQHVLDGNPLGHFAVKKIAVGESHSYLLKILREVRLLERLHHPNIITYHHAWLENSQFSSFGPKVPTLHVLMQWAEGGSLDDFIDVRLGRKPAHIHMHPVLSASSTFDPSFPPSPASSTHELPPDGDAAEPTTPTQTGASPKAHGKDKRPRVADADHADGHETQQPQQHASSKPDDPHSRSARIRAFRAFQRAPPEEKERMRSEMEGTFGAGMPPGVAGSPGAGGGGPAEWTAVHLLSAEEVKSLFAMLWKGWHFCPRAMLSDFGTSRDMINSTRVQRSGNTGTLEYTAPESLPSPHTGLLQQIDSKADMWSLGMILHKLLFFKLPYRFKSTPSLVAGFEARRLPRAFLVLLENLLHKSPAARPSSERRALLLSLPQLQLPTLKPAVFWPSHLLPRFWDQKKAVGQQFPQEKETWRPGNNKGWGVVGMRVFRSSLLVMKVVTIPRVCPDPTTRPRPLVAVLLLSVALVDTVIDHGDEYEPLDRARREKEVEHKSVRERRGGLIVRRMRGVWITAGLALFHLSVLWMSTPAGGLTGSAGVEGWWGNVCCSGGW
ncbi:hypothetical protein BDZ97DRAFT_2064311 [Flammula alnicola]|nr:hypothetical protein BDZ97DRAFT_2064311 [Flammula alnicola]